MDARSRQDGASVQGLDAKPCLLALDASGSRRCRINVSSRVRVESSCWLAVRGSHNYQHWRNNLRARKPGTGQDVTMSLVRLFVSVQIKQVFELILMKRNDLTFLLQFLEINNGYSTSSSFDHCYGANCVDTWAYACALESLLSNFYCTAAR